MHHGLYLLKMALLADTIAFTTTEERGQVEHMAEFIALFHGPLFLQASLAAAAPRLDLQLWQHMEAYGLTEPVVAKATKDSLMRHLWYLAQELVILGLFSPDVSDQDKAQIAQNLLGQERPETFSPGRPAFPPRSLLCNAQSLASFVGSRSWQLFSLLGASGRWLQLPPSQWSEDEEYARKATVIRQLAVVNDAAERGVKDCTEYADVTRDGALRGRIIAVASSHRAAAPSLLKHELEKL